jgi:hypothetical protein
MSGKRAGAKTRSVWVPVRASVHLPKLARGHEAIVDATDPYIQRMIEKGYLIPVGDEGEIRRGE